ncbi:MAG: MoaD/ThiS family protein [Nitrospira sp.]|nr:MoaD/ThiS family protein [Nitrospira sp.]MDH4304283.1 MoaD/ThiS family protein [Nitrospira sp.]MDH5193367.1 MoaD/ThiS family protein [Nitrospira sp.]
MASVQIFGHVLQAVVEDSEVTVPVSAPTTVKQLVEHHPAQLGGLLPYLAKREVLITINKKIGSEDSPVCDGDVVKLSFQSRVSYDGNRDIPT